MTWIASLQDLLKLLTAHTLFKATLLLLRTDAGWIGFLFPGLLHTITSGNSWLHCLTFPALYRSTLLLLEIPSPVFSKVSVPNRGQCLLCVWANTAGVRAFFEQKRPLYFVSLQETWSWNQLQHNKINIACLLTIDTSPPFSQNCNWCKIWENESPLW